MNQAETVEVYNGRPIYLSNTEHVEFVGGTMYRVDAGEYFAEARREPIPYEMPGTQNEVLFTHTDLALLKANLTAFERAAA